MVVRKRLKYPRPALVFVTTTAKDWLPVFANKQAADCIISQLAETLNYFGASLIGYVLMPTHLHMLIGLPELSQLSNFMGTFKSLSSRKIKRLNQDVFEDIAAESFQLWMPRFDDLVIISAKQFRIKLEYMHNNPAKAGLTKKATDWRYSSAGDWLEGRDGLLYIDKEYKWTKG